MKRYLGYMVYMLIALVIWMPVMITPLTAQYDLGAFNGLQSLYKPTCHQLTSRSLCYFPAKMSVEDCFPSTAFSPSRAPVVSKEGFPGYKFPVCARDIGIYLFMVLGGIAFAIVRKADDTNVPPAIWFILALVPIGIDGTGQLLGFWESTNTMRLVTGAIAGFAVPFYVIPMFNTFFVTRYGRKKEEARKKEFMKNEAANIPKK